VPAQERGREPPDDSTTTGSITLEAVLAAPGAYDGRTITLDGLYKIGTRLSKVSGPGGNVLGWSLPVGRNEGGTICSGEGKVEGRDTYLLVDDGLAPFLDRVFQQLRFRTAVRPHYKCILTVTVRPLIVENTRVPIVHIIGMEILGMCDFLRVAQRRYENAFETVRITPEQARVAYGDGALWVERLGGEEKFVQPLRRKLRELQHRMVAEGNQAGLNRLGNELARVVNVADAQCFVGRGSVLMGTVILRGSSTRSSLPTRNRHGSSPP
jgi:hypothetical protein